MVLVSEKRSYTTIALSKKVYAELLGDRHDMEWDLNKSLSFNDVVSKLHEAYKERRGSS